MNIFVLDYDPVKAAKYHCDKHIVKMINETVQLLSTAHHLAKHPIEDLDKLPKKTHQNHPCAVWVRADHRNYVWAWRLLKALLKQYRRRYLKDHAYSKLLPILRTPIAFVPYLKDVEDYSDWDNMPAPSEFVLAMPVEYMTSCAVKSYRKYYLRDKAHFAKWKYSATPTWWLEGLKNE